MRDAERIRLTRIFGEGIRVQNLDGKAAAGQKRAGNKPRNFGADNNNVAVFFYHKWKPSLAINEYGMTAFALLFVLLKLVITPAERNTPEKPTEKSSER